MENQQVKSECKVIYAKAARIYHTERRNEGINQKKETSIGQEQSHNHNSGISVDRLVLFLAYVTNCSDQAKTKPEKIKIIVKAAAKFLNVKDLLWEKTHTDLNQGEEMAEGTSLTILYHNVNNSIQS